MKILRINNKKGEYSVNGVDYKPIDIISKEDILKMIDLLTTEDCELDELTDDKMLPNQAHLIIYKNLFQKFNELLNSKSYFYDLREKTYLDAINKYKIKS